MLFPFRNPRNTIETRVSPGQPGFIEVLKHDDGTTRSLGRAELEFSSGREAQLLIQSAKGAIAVSLNEKEVLDVPENTILSGTIAFKAETQAALPIKSLTICRRNMFVDRFPVTATQKPSGEWKIQDGVWKIEQTMQGEGFHADGQLIASGPGAILTGESAWEESLSEVNVLFDEQTEIALIGWSDKGESINLVCSSSKIEIQESLQGSALPLTSFSFSPPLSGWHRISLSLGAKNITGAVDGAAVVTCPGFNRSGQAGLKNIGPLAVFDDYEVLVLAERCVNRDLVNRVDPNIVQIETDLLEP